MGQNSSRARKPRARGISQLFFLYVVALVRAQVSSRTATWGWCPLGCHGVERDWTSSAPVVTECSSTGWQSETSLALRCSLPAHVVRLGAVASSEPRLVGTGGICCGIEPLAVVRPAPRDWARVGMINSRWDVPEISLLIFITLSDFICRRPFELFYGHS